MTKLGAHGYAQLVIHAYEADWVRAPHRYPTDSAERVDGGAGRS
jgi:hypothetical protein